MRGFSCRLALSLLFFLRSGVHKVAAFYFPPQLRVGTTSTNQYIPVLKMHPGADSIVNEEKISLETGINAQVMWQKPKNSSKEPPLVFIHGSFHAAWCWAENYFEYFISLGYPVIALSLRGTGGSFAGEGVRKIKIEEHVGDVHAFLNSHVSRILGSKKKPVLISHSFGGSTVMKLLELYPDDAEQLSGIITMCSVPPSGNGPMTLRFLRRSLIRSYMITVGFVLKRCIIKDDLCRELFFGGKKVKLPDGTVDDLGVSDEDIRRYQTYFKRDTEAVIDVGDFLKNLPSKAARDGKAPSLSRFPPCLVLGASRDFIVDEEGVEETARYYGLTKPLFVESPHDVMLGENWRNAADAIHLFVQDNVKK